jgi:hypothetical protein
MKPLNLIHQKYEISLKYKKSCCVLYASILYTMHKESIIQDTICDIIATVLK